MQGMGKGEGGRERRDRRMQVKSEGGRQGKGKERKERDRRMQGKGIVLCKG